MKLVQAAELLQTVSVFSGLDLDTRLLLAEKAELVEVDAGATVFEQGSLGEQMYVVVDGRLQVHAGKTVLNTLHARDSFGEYALLDTVTRTASVTALEPCRLLAVDKQSFLAMLGANTAATMGIIHGLIERITTERDRSEALLQNILPREVANEYKRNGRVAVRKYERVSLLFADFSGFSRVSRTMLPEQVIEELDRCFSAFDEITDRHAILKLKTTGDGYMCAGGIPVENTTNALDVVLASLEIQRFMVARVRAMTDAGRDYWRCRIGINTGPCIAAVIGSSKLTYDVWSDTVNVASRMESGGEAGRVNIGRPTHELIRDFFDCEYRGRIPAKGHAPLDMYFVNGIHTELSRHSLGQLPNEAFHRLARQRFGG